MTPVKLGIPFSISLKPVKLGTSNSIHSFDLVLSSTVKYNIYEMGRGLGHVTLRIFGIPSTISPKSVKLETSNLVHRFASALRTTIKCNISVRGVA